MKNGRTEIDAAVMACLKFFYVPIQNLATVLKSALQLNTLFTVKLLSLEVPGVPWHPQILADQLTLSQQGGGDGRLCPPDFETFLRP